MKVAIATENEGKIEGAKNAFLEFFEDFEIEGKKVSSDVPDEPVNDQIYKGAKNRVKNLKKLYENSAEKPELYLAIESGITNNLGDWMITNIAVAEDNKDFESFGTSSSFPVPEKFVEDIIKTDLSQVLDQIFGEDKERGRKNGGIMLLTEGKVSRIDLTKQAFIMTLTKYINKDIWR